MLRKDFDYELPEELIAQCPTPQRDAARLLALDGVTGEHSDRTFGDIVELTNPGDLLVFNNTKVIPARLLGRKPTGGQVEILIERCLDETSCLAWARASKPLRTGGRVSLEGGFELEVGARQQDFFVMRVLGGQSLAQVLQAVGRAPLPPYIRRAATPLDACRYQTVYAAAPGAVAAPTAGLHFTKALLRRLKDKGVAQTYVTLHVGAGTFQPLRTERVEDHKMHSEWCQVGGQVCERARAAKQAGKRVIAVGTTSARCLESAAVAGRLEPFQGETDVFIYPGFNFQTVDAMITNFHLPGSTLLILVCAFAGRRHVLRAYRHAIREKYRFFSYGDAMFISRNSALH